MNKANGKRGLAALFVFTLCLSSAEAVTFNANTAMMADMAQGTPTNIYTDAQGGVWTYARSTAVAGGTVIPLDSQATVDTFCRGFKPSGVSHPEMYVNTGTEVVAAVVPGEMLIHPFMGGTDMPYAVLRFTVPSAGTYNVAATFRDLSPGGFGGGGQGVDVHVVVNGHDVDHALVNLDSALPSYTANVRWVPLAVGDTVDFVVGPNGTFAEAYWNDSTGFFATVTKVAATFNANTAMKTDMTQGTPINPYTDAQGGGWTYGRSASAAGGTVIPLDSQATVNTFCRGFKPSDNSHPEMYVNTGTGNDSSFGLPIVPGEIDIHPFTGGTDMPYAVLRFTVPSAGIYNVAATFRDLSSGGFSGGGRGVDVHVVVNGNDVDHAVVDVDSPLPSYTANLRLVPLAAGDTVDFVVGPNGTFAEAYWNDSTGFFAAITEQVPSMPEIISLDINGYNYVRDTDPVPVSGDVYSGAARIGSAGDYWNSVGVSELTVTNFAVPNLKLADGTTDTAVRFSMVAQSGTLLSSDRIPGQWALNPLLNDYLVVSDQTHQFTISGLLPNATYDIFFYCGAGIFANGGRFVINGVTYASELQWFYTSGTDLAVCAGVAADSSGSIAGTFSSRDNVSGTLAGLQITGTFPRRRADIVNIDFNGYTPGDDPVPGAGDTYTGAGRIGGDGDFWNSVPVASGDVAGFTMPKLKLADGITNSLVTFSMSRVGDGTLSADRISNEWAANTLLNDYLSVAAEVTNRFTITGLVPGAKYDLYFYCTAGIFANPGRVVIGGATYDSFEIWFPGIVDGAIKGFADHAVCPGIVAGSSGAITGDFCKAVTPIPQAVLSGLQIIGSIPRVPQGTLICVQ